MKVRVLSKDLFDTILPRMRIENQNVEEHFDKAFISITDGDREDIHYFNKDYKNVLNLEFDDASDLENERRIKFGQTELILFTRQQGQQIIDFLDENKGIETLYVHCLAGRSRSGAIGTFANDIYGKETFYEFCNSNPTISPNYYILALLKRIYNGIADEN
jgi:predicted protein tyrosine phosphatase